MGELEGRLCTQSRKQRVYANAVLSTQLCWEPKAILKKIVYFYIYISIIRSQTLYITHILLLYILTCIIAILYIHIIIIHNLSSDVIIYKILDACVCACMFSWVQLFATLWTIVCQAPLFMGFSLQEYWSGLSFPFPKYLMIYS